MRKTNLIKITAACILAASSSAAFAHLNIAREDAVAVAGSRQYKEGSSAFLDVNISHDCSDADGNHYATTGVTMVLPNEVSVPGAITMDRSGNVYPANAIMSIKQRINHTFKKNIVMKGAVDEFYNHGPRNEDVRALKWLRGKVDNDHYDNLELKASFPKIDPESCLAEIKMYFPTVQYCKGGYKIAWVGDENTKYGTAAEPMNPKTRVTETYAASVSVLRTSELPNECGNDGETVEIRPSTEDINKYLGRKKHMSKKKK